MSIINFSNVRRAVKFAGACLAVDAVIDMATSYEARSAYEFANLVATRKRARANGLSVEPMTNAKLMERARCNVGGYESAKYNLRKHGEHTALMIATTYVEDREHHYIDTMRQVTVLASIESGKAFLESECARKDDGRLVGEHSRNNDVFIFFDGEKPNAWTDAIKYELKVI